MKKGILSGLGVLFVVAILISGCGKSEEKKAEAPPVEKQTGQQEAMMVQEKAAAVKQEVVEKAAIMTEQAVETAKEMGQQALESTREKMSEEGQQAVDTVKQYGGDLMEKTGIATGIGQAAIEEAKAASEVKAPEVETESAPKDAGTSLEQALKEKAADQGMKLPYKY